MRLIDSKEVKQIQLDILENIHSFCIAGGIKYSLACGTMLGAVRHKGYIPWDDDIDIYLLREDYNKLIKSFPETYNEYYKLASLERDNEWDRPLAKAYDSRTILKENTTSKKNIGVNIDIFPIDATPNEYEEWQKYNKKRLLLQRIFALKFVNFKKDRVWYKNLTLLFVRILLSFVSKRHLAIYLNKYSQKYNETNSCYVFENIQGIKLKRRFKKEIFDHIIDIPFENRIFKGFKNYDEYLSNAYGDYMKLPPVDKRVTHHDFEAYMI